MNWLCRITYGALVVTLCGCGNGDQAKITKMANACIMDNYHKNNDIQTVENVQILNFGSDKATSDDKGNGITSIIPFDAKYSILLRSANGVWQSGLMHLEAVRYASGERKIRTVPVPGDAAYTAGLQRFEPWTCDAPANG